MKKTKTAVEKEDIKVHLRIVRFSSLVSFLLNLSLSCVLLLLLFRTARKMVP